MSEIQHSEARKLLPLMKKAMEEQTPLTYGSASLALGRDPSRNSRMVAQVCDLLDAAAAYAEVPLLALVAVREKSGRVNSKAWAGDDISRRYRERIVERSLNHKFSNEDFKAIEESLAALGQFGNVKAWKFLWEIWPRDYLCARLAGEVPREKFDAISDLGSERPEHVAGQTIWYARDSKVREYVMGLAKGRCEYCGEIGFECANGKKYLEAHHIIALANDGADRPSNVIALCPRHHREAHYGVNREAIEEEMMRIVRAREARTRTC